MAVPDITQASKTPGAKKLWTREQAARLTELFPLEHYELIEGELINKMGQKPPHSYVIMLLVDALASAFGMLRLRIQMSIDLSGLDGISSEPEPDVVLLKRGDPAEFSKRHPGPEDIALLIEVSDTTLELDRNSKCRLYARNGISEYWIIDIRDRLTFVHRRPEGEEYLAVTICKAEEEISPLGEPGFVFSLTRLLP